MVKHYIRADITTPKGAPRINYPEGWYDNVHKISVMAYDDPNRKCLAWLEDEDLFNLLVATGRVEELSESDFTSEVARLRPPPPDVYIRLRSEAVKADAGLQTALESVATGRGHTVKTEEGP